MNINEILGDSAYDSIEYQTGEGTEAVAKLRNWPEGGEE